MRRGIAVSVITLGLVAAGGVTACASAGHQNGPGALADARADVPVPGSREGSARLARALLGRLVLPRGSRRLPDRPLPAGLRQPGSTSSASTQLDRYRLFALPLSMAASASYLAAHAPAGMTRSSAGSTSGPGGLTAQLVTDTQTKPPAGIDVAEVVISIVPRGPHGSVLRADAQVTWFPSRSAAEYLDPASYRAVRIEGPLSTSQPRPIRRTFTSAAVIGRLARLLNSLHGSPGGIYHCPLITASYHVSFQAIPGRPDVRVDRGSCAADLVSVGGAVQPALDDVGAVGTLGELASKLLRSSRPAPWPAGGSPALARALGVKLVTELVLPRGSRRVGPQSPPERAEVIGSPHLVDVARFFWLPASAPAALSFLEQHAPHGTRHTGDGTTSMAHSARTEQFVSYALTAPPGGIDNNSMMLVSLVPGLHGGTVIRADAEMIWYPPRSAVEYIRASAYRAATVRLSVLKPHRATFTRTFTELGTIARLARLFDSMHTAVPGAVSFGCFMPATFTLGFATSAGRPSQVTVRSDFCAGDRVTVRGQAQPTLYDPDSSRALRLIAAMLGVHRRMW